MRDTGFFIRNPINYIADAIILSAIQDSTKDYGYGLHIMNHSWRFDNSDSLFFNDNNVTLIREATHFANRAKVTFIASRGNEGYNNQAYPAILDDDWVLCVGGTGTNGEFANDNPSLGRVNCEFTASSGWEIDVAAPASDSIVTTLQTGRSQIGDNDYEVDMSTLSTGFYIYRIQNGSEVFHVKTIKN